MYRRRGHYYQHAREAHAQQEERVMQLVIWTFNIGWVIIKLFSFVRWIMRSLR